MYDIVRPVGKLENFSTARHSLGFYKCVCHTAKYRFEVRLHDEEIRKILISALHQVVPKHAALQCGIIGEDTRSPCFVAIQRIDLGKHLEVEVMATGGNSHDDVVIGVLNRRHSSTWENMEVEPPWQAIAVKDHREDGQTVFDLVFAFHHALSDGLGGLVFHYDMLQAIRSMTLADVNYSDILTIESRPTMSKPIEQLVIFPVSWQFFFKQAWTGYAPSWLQASSQIWAGSSIFSPGKSNCRTALQLITVSNTTKTRLLSACVAHHTTLTGLLHGCIVSALAILVPSAITFASCTPYNLRSLTGASVGRDMVVQVSATDMIYPPAVVEALRATADQNIYVENCIWEVGRLYRATLVEELAKLPKDNQLGMLGYVSDWHKMLHSRLGRPRTVTFEVSNVGILQESLGTTSPSHQQGSLQATIERNIFSQSGSVSGPAVAFNVASINAGSLTICLSWQEGVLENGLGETIGRKVQELLEMIAGR